MAIRQPAPIPSLSGKQVARFSASFTSVDGGCWEWVRTLGPRGYGAFSIKGRTYRAHRVSFAIFRGRDPGSFWVCHTCDNPLCVNPDHLWLGTPRDNNEDMRRKGRGWPKPKVKVPPAPKPPRAPVTHCIKCGHHRIDDYGAGTIWRRCRACHDRATSNRIKAKKEAA